MFTQELILHGRRKKGKNNLTISKIEKLNKWFLSFF